MNEKLVAGIVAAAGIAPLCALCVLGPAMIGSVFAGAFAWLGGAGPLLTVALLVAAGLLVYRNARLRHKPSRTPGEDRCGPRPQTIENGQTGVPGVASKIWPPKQGKRL